MPVLQRLGRGFWCLVLFAGWGVALSHAFLYMRPRRPVAILAMASAVPLCGINAARQGGTTEGHGAEAARATPASTGGTTPRPDPARMSAAAPGGNPAGPQRAAKKTGAATPTNPNPGAQNLLFCLGALAFQGPDPPQRAGKQNTNFVSFRR